MLFSDVDSASELLAVGELIASVLREGDSDEQQREASFERLTFRLSAFAERPQLLDRHLPQLLTPAVSNLPSRSACRVVALLCKVRGATTVAKLLPLHVTALQQVSALLETSVRNTVPWEVAYVHLLWLSELVLLPMRFHTIHSDVGALLALAKHFLFTLGKPSDAAQWLLARLLTRPDLDVLPAVAEEFTTRCFGNSGKQDAFAAGVDEVLPMLGTLCHIFKLGQRERLQAFAPNLLRSFVPLAGDLMKRAPALHRKLMVKLCQRAGLVFLPPRVAPWRYQRGNRILLSKTKKSTNVQATATMSSTAEDAEASPLTWNVPEEVDQVVDVLLTGLRDKDTIVRWSSAKGIGRIVERLPQDFGDEVVDAIMELCSPSEEECAWHGSCLALAELARRGLLLPARLAHVFPAVLEALRYDVKLGTRSVGSQVRDAACYVLWACARAYASSVLEPYTVALAGALLETIVLDREINCRRAASAALQEHIGRVGLIAHGLDLVTITDFFRLGSLRSAYQNVGSEVGKFPEYGPWIVETLVERKLRHWDANVREQGAILLGRLLCEHPDSCKERILSHVGALRDRCVNVKLASVEERHGALLGLAEIFRHVRSPTDLADDLICMVVPELDAGRLFRGKGGEMVRVAACVLTECISHARIPLVLNTARLVPLLMGPAARPDAIASRSCAKRHKEFLDECFKHPADAVQSAAAKALRQFCSAYLCDLGAPVKRAVISAYCKTFETADEPASHTRGAARALGALPDGMFDDTSRTAAHSALARAVISNADAETRMVAMDAMQVISSEAVEALLKGLRDYALDDRGDVGSWVREAACRKVCLDLEKRPWTLAQQTDAVSALVEICCGRLDRTRRHGRVALLCVVKSLAVPHAQELVELFQANAETSLNADAKTKEDEEEQQDVNDEQEPAENIVTQPVVEETAAHHSSDLAPVEVGDSALRMDAPSWSSCVSCLSLAPYRRAAFRGLCVSAGLRSPDPAAKAALLEYFTNPRNAATAADFWRDDVEHLICENKAVERVLPHLLACLDALVRNGSFDAIAVKDADRVLALRSACWSSFQASSSFQLLTVGIDLMAALLRFPSGAQESLSQLVSLLSHRFPKIRQHCAIQIQLQLVLLPHLYESEEKRANATVELLSEDVSEAKVRAILCTELKKF